MSFSTQWQQQLHSTGSQITTVLGNHIGIYSASSGYIYRHDPLTGEILSQTSLADFGTRDIRLATPINGEPLVAGIDGHIIATDPTTLEIKWHKHLPNSQNSPVILLVDSNYIYAICNDCVYCLDLSTGQILSSNGLSQYDFTELRLAISDDHAVLFIGMSNYVVAFQASELGKVLWRCDLPGVEKATTSVMSGLGVVYAGCNGSVFRIESSSGKITHINDLGGISKSDIRFAIGDLRTHLWVGTKTYGIVLHPDDISTIFSENLFGSGSSVTHVIEDGHVAYFANNAYVSCLNLNGDLIRSSKLPGTGKAGTTLSVNSASELIIGVEGHCMLLILAEFPQQYGPWMANMAATIGSKPLRKVAIPGSHDSCTNLITSSSRIGLDNQDWMKDIDKLPIGRQYIKEIMARWAVAQPLDVMRQLEAGIRYFDLRLQNSDNDTKQDFVHGLVSGPLDGLISQVRSYMAVSGNEREIIMLDFNHLYGFTDNAHQAVINKLLEAFGNKLAPASLGVDVTVNELWNSTYRIICFYDNSSVVFKTPFLWSSNKIPSFWPNTAVPATLINKLESEIPKLSTKSTFHVFQGLLTPNTNTIANGIWRPPHSLKELSGMVNDELVNRLKSTWKGKGINVFICDWFHLADGYVDAVVGLNN